jgi:hypothetical protein
MEQPTTQQMITTTTCASLQTIIIKNLNTKVTNHIVGLRARTGNFAPVLAE